MCEDKLIAYIFARLYNSFDLGVALTCLLFLEINITAFSATESSTEMRNKIKHDATDPDSPESIDNIECLLHLQYNIPS